MLELARSKLDFELKPENLEDLWVLSQFIVSGDKIEATTERKVKIGDDRAKQVKKIIRIELNVKKTKFEHNILRITGEILNETEFTSIGQSHTLNFNVSDKVKIKKNSILKFEEKILKRALESKKSLNLLILLDKDELVAAEFGDFSFSILYEKQGLGSKKGNNEEINEEEEKFKILQDTLKRDYSNIIFAGPGNAKESLKKYIDSKLKISIVTFAWSDVSNLSIQKVIRKIHESSILKDSRLAEESQGINELLKRIHKKEKSIYGYDNTVLAVNEGKVEELIISTKLIDQFKEEDKYLELNELMRNTENLNGNLIIADSKNEPGKILDGLGGIAALCRY